MGTLASGSIDLKSLKIAGEPNKYITKINDDGITIHAANSAELNYVQIDAEGVEIFKSNGADIDPMAISVANFGENGSRVGAKNSGHTIIQASGLQVFGSDGTYRLAHIGYGSGNADPEGQSPIGNAPYYSLGIRNGDIGNYSVAEGIQVIASGYASHAEGGGTRATGAYSHAEGEYNYATGEWAHAEGGGQGDQFTLAQGDASHSEGRGSSALGDVSHAQNVGTRAKKDGQTAIGFYNIIDNSSSTPVSGSGYTYDRGTYAFIIGNGTDTTRSNAFTVNWNGNTWCAGSYTNGSDKRLKTHVNYLNKDAVKFIQELKPVHFIKNDEHHTGFYAQDIQEIDPWGGLIGQDSNEYLTLCYTDIIAPLVTYCQHLEKEIEQLKKEIQELKNK